jgi:hypothetical protein
MDYTQYDIDERDRQIRELREENADLRGRLDSANAHLSDIDRAARDLYQNVRLDF